MASEFVELGLEGADKLIDKHFDKIPDKALHSDTYKPHRFRRESDDQRNDDSRESDRDRDRHHHHHHHSSRGRDEDRRDSAWEEQEAAAEEGRYTHSRRQQELQQNNKWDSEWDNRRDSQRTSPSRSSMAQPYSSNTGRPSTNGHSTIYAQDGPAVAAPWTGLPDYHSPASAGRANMSQQFSPRDSTARPASRVDTYNPATYRPSQPRRRSSSYHGPRDRHRFDSSSEDSFSSDDDSDHRRRQPEQRSRNNQQQLARKDNNSSSNGDYRKSAAAYARSDRTAKSNPHSDRDFKENIKDNFTDSPQGLAGSALGALVGGFVTHKALESRGGKDQGNRDKALTLLGAVVGGVAINAVVDKFEDRKVEQGERRRKGREIREERERERERAGRGERDGGRRARSEKGDRRERDRDSYR